MNSTYQTRRHTVLMCVASLLLIDAANADVGGDRPPLNAMRTEIWIAATSWPSLADLHPVIGGSFSSVGFGLGASLHWPLRSLRVADLMFGVEGAIMATESDIPVYLDEMLARDGYLAASLKWRFGKARKLSLDVGLAYHLLDITQLETGYNAAGEFESWEETALGPFFGFGWDSGGSDATKRSGLTLGLQAHFVDFGTVRDEDVLASVILGRDAGKLDGPMVALRLGYRWR